AGSVKRCCGDRDRCPSWNGARCKKRKWDLDVGDGGCEHSVVNKTDVTDCLHVNRLEPKIVLGLRRERDYRVCPPCKRGERKRRRNAIPLRIDRRIVVARRDCEGQRRRGCGYYQAAAQNARKFFMHTSHL